MWGTGPSQKIVPRLERTHYAQPSLNMNTIFEHSGSSCCVAIYASPMCADINILLTLSCRRLTSRSESDSVLPHYRGTQVMLSIVPDRVSSSLD